jgi:hypothetical protein
MQSPDEFGRTMGMQANPRNPQPQDFHMKHQPSMCKGFQPEYLFSEKSIWDIFPLEKRRRRL